LQGTGVTVGQNDIWIAATASVTGLTVLSTDKDFKRLVNAVSVAYAIPIAVFDLAQVAARCRCATPWGMKTTWPSAASTSGPMPAR
jgi:hypothetical protein